MSANDQEPIPGSTDAIAVAINYEGTCSKIPKITATGKGAVAEQILQLAFDHGVKVREDSDLAQILSEIEVDCPIPLEAFAAVSEILSYLYRSQNKTVPDLSFTNDD
ncbi:MAG: EscU/YscU/HrcU family type III secretion system export apparatus switch protein [Sneathiella sp.]